MNQVLLGDCLDILRTLTDNSVDSVVTDPPYGLSFMNKHWDYDVPTVEIWAECLRVLKPGGHLLAFAGTRTQHRMAVRIEDAGFEIRDLIAWVYGSGFPKSLDVSKAIDKAAGVERDRVPGPKSGGMASLNKGNAAHGYRDAAYYDDGNMMLSPDPATDAARQWSGWGTALKPALEPVTVARKPLIGTVADNVLTHGTGGLNVDGCRVGTETRTNASKPRADRNGFVDGFVGGTQSQTHDHGRWPANLIHDGAEYFGDQSRFFYTAKASKSDRDEGLAHLPEMEAADFDARPSGDFAARMNRERPPVMKRNHHPTVKPTDLMRYLCRLVTPPGGTVLDPFMGSGSTGKAAALEGFNFIGIEREPEYHAIAKARIAAVEPKQFTLSP